MKDAPDNPSEVAEPVSEFHDSNFPFPVLKAPIMIHFEGKDYPLKYTIGSLRRIREANGGKSVASIEGGKIRLMDINEEMLMPLLIEGLRTAVALNQGKLYSDVQSPLSLEQLDSYPSSAFHYLFGQFALAYAQSHPKGAPAATQPKN